MRKLILSIVLVIFAFTSVGYAGNTTKKDHKKHTRTHKINLNKGVALKGYDPVSFYRGNGPKLGKRTLKWKHDGAYYYFSTRKNRDMFKENPKKYTPMFGGYCAFGVSKGKLVRQIDPLAYEIINGKLLMQSTNRARHLFIQDSKQSIKDAKKHWKTIGQRRSTS